MTDPKREAVARIIDPEKWAVLDSYLADMLRKYKGQNIGYDPEPFKDRASLAKADAILALGSADVEAVEFVVPYGNASGANHFRKAGTTETLCGRNSYGWSIVKDADPSEVSKSEYTCKRCAAALSTPKPAEPAVEALIVRASLAILDDLRDRRLLKWLFAEDADTNPVPIGYVDGPIDNATQVEIAVALARAALAALTPADAGSGGEG